MASSRIRSGSPDAQKPSSASSNASPASTRDWFSSSTRKRGSMPASKGWAFSRRWQKPWIVEIQAPSSSLARSCLPSSASRCRIRPRSSPAARSVYVIASTESMGRPRSQTARTKRSTSTVVLPVPAPAETKTSPPASIAASCSSFGARFLDHGHDLATRHIDHRSHHVGQGAALRVVPHLARPDALDEMDARAPSPARSGPRRLPRRDSPSERNPERRPWPRPSGARGLGARRRARGRARPAARCRRDRAVRACTAGFAA